MLNNGYISPVVISAPCYGRKLRKRAKGEISSDKRRFFHRDKCYGLMH